MQEYELLKRQILKGWNTWNTRSMLSHAHLPEGFAINLCLKDNGKSAYLKEVDAGNKQPWDAHVFPGPHAYDGSYTKLRMNWYDTDTMKRRWQMRFAQFAYFATEGIRRSQFLDFLRADIWLALRLRCMMRRSRILRIPLIGIAVVPMHSFLAIPLLA